MPKQSIHGILLLDKPSGISSMSALARAKRLLNAQKAGHTGTLDPLASGLLPLCFGEASKFAADLLAADKTYHATLQLGITTTTGDAEGRILTTHSVDIERATIETSLGQFRGTSEQTPPMYSALKHDGKAYYEYARAGINLERTPRTITIDQLEILDYHQTQLAIMVRCSKGTYIRTLAEDIGIALGCGAHLTALRRTRVGSLRLEDALTLEQLEKLEHSDARAAHLSPLDRLLSSLPRVDLDTTLAMRFCHGQRIHLKNHHQLDADLAQASDQAITVRVYANHHGLGQFLGIAQYRADQILAPRRVITSAMLDH